MKNVSKKLILDFAEGSGLLHQEFSLINLEQSFEVKDNYIKLLHGGHADRLAQVIARFLRQEMIEKGFSHTYETVFSHPSTIDDIKKARTAGFTVVLYFVATESPEINKERVKLRVKEKGHAVPEALIESRYYRSLDLVFDASQECDEVWFLDNSRFQNPFTKVARFKKVNGIKVWDKIEKNNISTWFIKYYYHKIQQTINQGRMPLV